MKNKLAPFNSKVKRYIDATTDPQYWFNVAEGSKRAGKNVCNVAAFCLAVDYSPDTTHLVAGVTVGTAIQNVIDCNGYGILNFFNGKIKKQKINERLGYKLIDQKGREKVIIVLGGGKSGDENKLRGNSYGCAYLTEANLLSRNFVKEAFDRTISSKYKKVFHDLNPMWDGHWYYEEILNSYKGINYCHFNIADNNSLSDNTIRELFRQYDKNSVWFKRDILGQRIASEGIIFRQVNETPGSFIATEEQVKRCNNIIIGIDFGGSKSKTAIVASGFFERSIVILKSELVAVNSDADTIAQELIRFIVNLKLISGANIISVQADSENQIVIATLRKRFKELGINIPILNCNKRTILGRIQLKENMLNSGRYFFNLPHATTAFESTKRQLWSEKGKDERLDDGTVDIDTADAEEYGWTSVQRFFI